MFKTRLGIVALAAVGLLAFGASAHALMLKNGDAVFVPKEETVAGSLYAAGANITVEGKVQGDLVCAGQNITVNGTVDGDVLCAGQVITINGNVGGSVRAAGNSIVINGKVARSVMAASANLILGSASEVGWDVLFGSATADIRGHVKRDIDGAGAGVVLGGKTDRNVSLMLDDRKGRASVKEEEKNTKMNGRDEFSQTPALTLAKGSLVGGSLDYTAARDATIEGDASVKGEVRRHEPVLRDHKDGKGMLGWLWWRIIVIFSALLIGLVLASWLRKPLLDISARMLAAPYKSFGVGALVMFVTPLVCFVLAITLIGIPLAAITLALWIIVMFLGKIITSIAVGHALLKRYGRKAGESYAPSLVWAMVAGVILMYIIFSIPVLGWLVSLVATCIGVGGVWLYGKAKSCASQE